MDLIAFLKKKRSLFVAYYNSNILKSNFEINMSLRDFDCGIRAFNAFFISLVYLQWKLSLN
jgi:hypothetical protein